MREALRKKIIEVKVFLKPVLMVKFPAYNEPFT